MKQYQDLAIQITAWIKEKDYIKIVHPKTQREILLVKENADIFEMIDDGYNLNIIYEKISKKYDYLTIECFTNIIDQYIEYNLIKEVSQFEI